MYKKAAILSLGSVMGILVLVFAGSIRALPALDTGSRPVIGGLTSVDNTPPIAFDITNVVTDEDSPVDIFFAASDPDGDELSITIVTPPLYGTLSGSGPMNRRYGPNLNFNGYDSLVYVANDGNQESNAATVAIDVKPVNDPPVSEAVAASTSENATTPISLSAKDPDNDVLTYTIIQPPAHGSLSDSPGPVRVYTPATGYSGSDSFIYIASDGQANSNESLVSITINAVDAAPVAENISAMTNEDTQVGINLMATDQDADPLTYTIVTNPQHGVVSPGTGAARTYTPAAHYNGQDSFTYKANDGAEDSNVATVSITINPVNDPPVASNTSTTVNKNTPKNITLPASDVDQDQLVYIIVDPPAHGSLSPDQTASRIYTPDNGYTGPDSFSFKANDGQVDSNTAVFSITVIKTNAPPVAENGSVLTNEDTPVNITLNASDEDSDPLTFTIVSLPTKGVLSGTGANRTYTPNPNANGSDSFTFKVNDGTVDSNVATVSITITPLNDKPVANDLSVSTLEDTPVNITLQGSDPDGNSLTYIIDSLPGKGVLTGSGANRTYTPNPGVTGSDSFTYKVNDGVLDSNTATVSITIQPDNDSPILDLDGGGAPRNYSTTYINGGAAVNITGANLAITDPDNATMINGSVRITERFNGDKEVLTVNTAGTAITSSFNAATGLLTLTGEDTIANYEKVLRTVKYQILPGTTNINTTNRIIRFMVNDGQDNSNAPETTVTIWNPTLQLTFSPSQPTVPKGGTVVFTVFVKNAGNVTLQNVVVQSNVLTGCGNTYAQLTPNQTQSFVCTVQNVTAPIDNVLTATANDVGSVPVSATSTVRIRLLADISINIAPNPDFGDTIIRGQNAVFDIEVINPLENSKMTRVKVDAFLSYTGTNGAERLAGNDQIPVPECSRVDDNSIGDLDPGERELYSCTITNVQDSFTIEVIAEGYIENFALTTNSDTSSISVVGLVVEVAPEPRQIPVGEPTTVEYALKITNSGDLPMTLTALKSDIHGNLFNPGNSGVSANTCPAIVKQVPAGAERTCSYKAVLNPPPDSISVTNLITAEATVASISISNVDSAIVVVGENSPVSLDLVATPDKLVSPGGEVTLSVTVSNRTESAITMTALTDSIVGDLNGKGSCVLPQTISAGDGYDCAYVVTVTDKAPGDVITHKVTATTSLGLLDDTVTILVLEHPPTNLLMPVVALNAVAGEPNNNACRAFSLVTDMAYYFLPDDAYDWHRFTLTTPRRVTIRMSNFVGNGQAEGQLVILEGDCTSSPKYIKHNGDPGVVAERTVDAGVLPAVDGEGNPITYYVWVVTDTGYSTGVPYRLQIQTSAP